MKALIDRSGMTSRANDQTEGGRGSGRAPRGGAIHAFDSINHFFTIGQMIIVGSSYWNFGVGRDKGEVAGDEEGIGHCGFWDRTWPGFLKKSNAESLLPVQFPYSYPSCKH